MSATLTYFGGLLAALAAILGLAMLFYQQCRATPEEGLAFAVLSVTLAVYAAALASNAKIAFYLLLFAAAVGFALTLTHRRITKTGLAADACGRKLAAFFSPAILLYLAVAAAAAIAFFGTCYQNWDEFAQWGKALRFMGETNLPPTGEAYDGMGYMQSATTYFHYFTGCFTGFDEAASYVSNVFISFAAVPLVFSGCERKDAPRVFLFGLAALIGLYALYELPYYNLYTDEALALWTGAVIAYRIAEGAKRTLRGWILTALAVAVIALIKPQAGILMAVLAGTAIAVMELAFPARGSVAPNPNKRRAVLLAAGFAVLLAVGGLVLKVLLSRGGGIYINTSRAREVLADRAYLAKVFFVLYRGLFSPLGNMDKLSYVTSFVFAAALTFLGAKALKEKPEKKRFVCTGVLFLIGFVVYFAITYLTFLFILSRNDALNGVSESRYLSLYVLAGFLPLTAPFFRRPQAETEGGTRVRGAVSLLILVLLGLNLSADVLYHSTSALRWDDPYYRLYMNIRANAERVIAVTDGEPIYYIYQGSDSAAAAAEYAYRRQWNRGAGAYRFTADGETATGLAGEQIEGLPEKLCQTNVQYLFVENTDEYLTERFKALFGVKALTGGDLFAVSNENGRAVLTFIENTAALAPEPRQVEKAH